jgi:uncharacterized protein YbjT (DUF2867 family)
MWHEPGDPRHRRHRPDRWRDVRGVAVGRRAARGVRPRLQRAARTLGADTPTRVGDLRKERTMEAALDGIEAVLLCSGHDPSMAAHQLTAVRAIASSGVRRVVKISGSPVSMTPGSPSRTARGHLAVEEALRGTGREIVAIRPNAFMQNFAGQTEAIAHGALPGPDGDPRVSFVDARDVGRVAAAALAADATPASIVEVTGPEALSLFEVAATLTAVLGRPVTHAPMSPQAIREALLAMGRPDWLADHTAELGALMREPKAAEVSDTVLEMTGRAPVSVDDFIAEHAAAFPAALSP